MSEEEIKNQIEHDARDYAIKLDSDYSENAVLHYATGANAQDKVASDRADKVATNRTVEQAIDVCKTNEHLFHYASDYITIIKELEKLKR